MNLESKEQKIKNYAAESLTRTMEETPDAGKVFDLLLRNQPAELTRDRFGAEWYLAALALAAKAWEEASLVSFQAADKGLFRAMMDRFSKETVERASVFSEFYFAAASHPPTAGLTALLLQRLTGKKEGPVELASRYPGAVEVMGLLEGVRMNWQSRFEDFFVSLEDPK
jgi:hypothetical protein